jgi:hypothetical protein
VVAGSIRTRHRTRAATTVHPDSHERDDCGAIFPQDFQSLGEVQQGMKSRGFAGARTNPVQEKAISNFHRALRRYLGVDGYEAQEAG